MASVLVTQHSEITPISGFGYLVELFYGENGNPFGPNEVVAGTPSSLQGTHVTWDEDPDDGVDSDWCAATMQFQQGNMGLHWQVKQSSALQASVGSFSGISHVDIRAAVRTQAAMLWQDLTVTFYKNGAVVDQATAASFGVDETQGSGDSVEQIMRITPGTTNCDKITVAASVRLMAPEGVYPAEDDIFSQIMIYTA